MRRFALRNADGIFFDLMRTDAFLTDPSGLGFSKSNEYLEVGSTYFLTKDHTDQGSITGTIYFKNETIYHDFCDFILSKPLTLIYQPDGPNYIGSIPEAMSNNDAIEYWNTFYNTNYNLDGEFTEIDKSDTVHNISYLVCNITFTAERKWYLPKFYLNGSDDSLTSKVYHSSRDPVNGAYVYPFTYLDNYQSTIRINNSGLDDSPTIIRIYGPITNPVWRLRYNGNTIASGAYTGTISEGYHLLINSAEDDLEVAIYDDTLQQYIENAYDKIDFDRETFILVPRTGRYSFCDLVVNGDKQHRVSVNCELMELYDTV